MSGKQKEIKLSTLLLSLSILFLGYILVVLVMFYGFGARNIYTEKVLKFLPFPAAIVGPINYISISEVEKDLEAVKRFYENQDFSELGYRVDFTTEDGKKRLLIKERKLLNKLIENKVMEIVAKEKGIKIEDEILSKEVDEKIEQYGTVSDVSENLKNLYGWDLNTFKERVVRPDMLKESLTKNMKDNDKEILVAKVKIETALSDLNAGKDFAEVAKKYSDGESAKNGGELGWLSTDQMIPEIALTSALLEKDQTSNVLESSLGFHLINVEDKKIENGLEMYKVKQIFVRTKNFADWLIEKEKNIKINVLLKDFYWDNENQIVRFKDDQLEKFENEIEENFPGDISVIF